MHLTEVTRANTNLLEKKTAAIKKLADLDKKTAKDRIFLSKVSDKKIPVHLVHFLFSGLSH